MDEKKQLNFAISKKLHDDLGAYVDGVRIRCKTQLINIIILEWLKEKKEHDEKQGKKDR